MKQPTRKILSILFLAFALLTATGAVAWQEQGQGDENKSFKVTGVLTDEGAECPALRGDDGQLYTLTPRDLQGFQVGDRVTVKGKVAERSFCNQGTTIEVRSISAAKDPQEK